MIDILKIILCIFAGIMFFVNISAKRYMFAVLMIVIIWANNPF